MNWEFLNSAQFKVLLLSKLGLLIAISPLLAVAYSGTATVEGVYTTVLILTVYGGAFLWGFGYGWLYRDDPDVAMWRKRPS